MTSLMPDRTRPSAGELRRDLRHRRPLVLLATLAGAAAAAEHAPGLPGARSRRLVPHRRRRARHPARRAPGRRAGLADGARLRRPRRRARWSPSMPLGITLVCGWVTWRIGHRLGDSISGHGPDAQRIADGERDWTVPAAAPALRRRLRRGRGRHRRAGHDRRHGPGHLPGGALVVPALRRARRARDRDRLRPGRDLDRHPAGVRRRPPPPRAGGCIAALAAGLAGGLRGRAGHRLRHRAQRDLPAAHRHAAPPCSWSSSRCWWSRTPWSSPAPTCSAPASPSAPTRSSRPAVVTIGALPMFPLLAALPDTGPTPAWTAALIGVAARWSAALGAMRAQRAPPDVPLGGGRPARLRRRHARRRRCSASSPLLAGGAVGPGRMSRRRPARRRGAGARASPPSASAACSAAWSPPGGSAAGLRAARARRRDARDSTDDPEALLDCTDPCRCRLVRGRSRAPRRPRLGLRHQPAGAARRLRRPGVRRHGGRRRRRPRRHRGAGAGRAGRACRRSCTGSRTSPTAPPGTRALTDVRRRARARPGRLGRLHEARRARRSWPRSAAGSSTPTRRCARRSPACTAPADALGVRRQGHRLHALRRRRRRRHRPDRRPGARSGSRTTTPSSRCTSGSRSPSAALLGRTIASARTGAARRAMLTHRLAQEGRPPGVSRAIERLSALTDE